MQPWRLHARLAIIGTLMPDQRADASRSMPRRFT